MRIIRTIGEKGQVVIPKDVRENFKLRKGTPIVFEIRNEEVVIKPKQDTEEFLEDFLNVPKLKKRIPWRKMKKELGERYEIH